MKLVPNWKSAWKGLSLRFMALAFVWETLPEETQAIIPDPWGRYVTLVLLLAAGVGRVVDQGTAKQ